MIDSGHPRFFPVPVQVLYGTDFLPGIKSRYSVEATCPLEVLKGAGTARVALDRMARVFIEP